MRDMDVADVLRAHLAYGIRDQGHAPFGVQALNAHRIMRDHAAMTNIMIDPDGSVHELIEGEVIRCA